MDRGYVKLWRKSIDSGVFASEQLWILWTWCLMKASHKKRFIKFSSGKGGLSVEVLPGQFVFGRNKAAEVFGWSPSTTWKRMQKLEEIGCISINSNKQYSTVSVCNWDIYQSDEDSQVTSKEQASDKQVTSKEQASDTNKNVKNVENVKNDLKDFGAKKPVPQSSKFDPLTFRPDFVSEKSWRDLVTLRRAKKAAQTKRGYQTIVNELSKAIDMGFSTDECIDKMCNRNWTGFEAKWMENDRDKQKGKKGFQTKQDINNEIQEIGAAINERTRFNPYRIVESRDSSGDADQGRRALPE